MKYFIYNSLTIPYLKCSQWPPFILPAPQGEPLIQWLFVMVPLPQGEPQYRDCSSWSLVLRVNHYTVTVPHSSCSSGWTTIQWLFLLFPVPHGEPLYSDCLLSVVLSSYCSWGWPNDTVTVISCLSVIQTVPQGEPLIEWLFSQWPPFIVSIPQREPHMLWLCSKWPSSHLMYSSGWTTTTTTTTLTLFSTQVFFCVNFTLMSWDPWHLRL